LTRRIGHKVPLPIVGDGSCPSRYFWTAPNSIPRPTGSWPSHSTWLAQLFSLATKAILSMRESPKELSSMSDVIHTLLERGNVSFEPEDIAKLVAGFESALTNLGLKERNDPATTQVAKLIIQLAKDGQRDPAALADRATKIVRGSS